MNYLILGGSGYLGKHWIHFLRKQNVEFDAPERSELDLLDFESFNKLSRNYEVILYLAAHTQAGDWCLSHPGEQWIKNQSMNTNVLRFWLEKSPNSKMVAMGTSCGYSPHLEMVEDNYLKDEPESSLLTYALTKRMLYQGLISINQQYGLDYLHLIPATLYGQNYHTDGRQKHFIFDLINKVSTAKSRNEDVILWGDGYQRRELTHVEDFIENATFFIQNFKNLSLNLGSQRDLSIREYAETISEIIGFDHLAIKYDTNAYTGSTKKLLNSKKAMNLYSDYKIRDLRDSLQKIIIP